MKFVLPSLTHEKSFSEALSEMRGTREMTFWEEVGSPKDVKQYIQIRLDHSEGKNLPQGWIPATTYWLIDGDVLIGEASIRHELTEHLRSVGGHIGYWVRPSQRKKGYGTQILHMALQKAKNMGIQNVRITCDETNTASRKIIEANGGKVDGTTDMGEKLPRKLLFWVSLQ